MNSRNRFLAWAALILILPLTPLLAADVSTFATLLERYPKGEIIRVVVSRCGGNITVTQPPDTQVYGRPREDLVTGQTLAADTQRCGISLASLKETLSERVNWSAPKGRVIRPRTTVVNPDAAAAPDKARQENKNELSAAGRAKKNAERESSREDERKRRAAQRQQHKAAALAAQEEREKQRLKQECEQAKRQRDTYYESINKASYTKLRQMRRDLYEKKRIWVIRNC